MVKWSRVIITVATFVVAAVWLYTVYTALKTPQQIHNEKESVWTNSSYESVHNEIGTCEKAYNKTENDAANYAECTALCNQYNERYCAALVPLHNTTLTHCLCTSNNETCAVTCENLKCNFENMTVRWNVR